MNLAQVRVGIEGRLELLRVELSILVENVRVNLGDHIDLRVSGITLRCFQVSVVELQFVSCTGMAEGMEYYPG